MAAYGNVQSKYLVEQIAQMDDFLTQKHETFASETARAEYEHTFRTLTVLRQLMREELARRGELDL